MSTNPEVMQPLGVPLWKVVSVKDAQILDQVRGFVAGKEVAVQLADRSTFTLQIALPDFTPASVQQMIEERVAVEAGVRGLVGPII